MSLVTYHATSAALDLELRAAFNAFRDQRARTGVIVLASDTRPRLELVDLVAELIAATPHLERLVFVHPSPSVGFFASSIGLRAGHVRVTSSTSIDTTAAAAVTAVARGVRSDAPAASAGKLETVEVTQGQDIAMALAAATVRAKARGASGIALVFSSEARPSSQLVDAVCSVLESNPAIVVLALVHPSPALGFLASSIGLRLPRVHVRAFRELREMA